MIKKKKAIHALYNDNILILFVISNDGGRTA